MKNKPTNELRIKIYMSLILLLGVLFSINLVSASYFNFLDDAIKTNLTFYLSLDNSYNDSLGIYNFSNAGYVNPVTFDSNAISNLSALFVSGGGSFGNSRFLNISSGNLILARPENKDFSLNFWVYKKGTYSNYFSGTLNISNYGWTIYNDGVSQELTYYQDNGEVYITSKDIIPIDKWTMITLVRNSTNTSIYINGTLQNITNSIYIENSTFNSFSIGNAGTLTNGNQVLNGNLDEFSYWQKGLSESEIDVLYYLNSGSFIYIGNQTFNSSTYETSAENFYINLFYNPSYSSISANLIYNGTSYSGTKIGSGSNIIFQRTLGINAPYGNKSFYWQIGLTNSSGTTYYTSTIYNQTVSQILLGLCNSTLSTPFFNLTFKDEATGNYINASIPYATFNYSLGDYTSSKTLVFINNTENNNYAFCFNPTDRNISVNSYVQYASTGYPQRVWNPLTTYYTNITTQEILYLLGTTSGQYVTFQVTNTAGQVLSGVELTATRAIGSGTEVVATGTTNDAGAVTFFLNYNFEHSILFSKSGYTDYTFVVTPTNTEYTITINSLLPTSTIDLSKGITIKVNPATDFLDNNTLYNFTYKLDSDYWEVIEFGFTLYYSNGSSIGSKVSYANSGTLTLQADSLNVSGIYMNYYYVIDSNYTYGSRTWIVQDTSGRGFSIYQFFQDLNRYTNLGMFGFDSFGKGILSILIIILVVGGVSYRYGIGSETAIMGILFGVVFFLDVGIGFLPEITFGGINPIPNFITFITFLILLGFIIKEESQ